MQSYSEGGKWTKRRESLIVTVLQLEGGGGVGGCNWFVTAIGGEWDAQILTHNDQTPTEYGEKSQGDGKGRNLCME